MTNERTYAMRTALERLVIETIAELCRLEPEAISTQTPLRDIGLDSLSLVSVASLIESVRGVELEQSATARLLEAERVGDVVAFLRGHEEAGDASA